MSISLWNPWDSLIRPARLWDQLFAGSLPPEEFIAPSILREGRQFMGPQLHPWDIAPSFSFHPEHFQANVDVQQFKPEEISVRITGDNVITVEGKHEEKPDEHGFVSRQFVRRYCLPEGHDINRIETKLSSDGVLTITAPKIACGDCGEAKNIPITHTGQPSNAINQF